MGRALCVRSEYYIGIIFNDRVDRVSFQQRLRLVFLYVLDCRYYLVPCIFLTYYSLFSMGFDAPCTWAAIVICLLTSLCIYYWCFLYKLCYLTYTKLYKCLLTTMSGCWRALRMMLFHY